MIKCISCDIIIETDKPYVKFAGFVHSFCFHCFIKAHGKLINEELKEIIN